jgi:hypothetical protein
MAAHCHVCENFAMFFLGRKNGYKEARCHVSFFCDTVKYWCFVVCSLAWNTAKYRFFGVCHLILRTAKFMYTVHKK